MNYVIKYRDYWRQGWTCFQGGRSTSSPEPVPDGEKRFARYCRFGVDGWLDEGSPMSSLTAIKRSADLLTELEAEGDDA